MTTKHGQKLPKRTFKDDDDDLPRVQRLDDDLHGGQRLNIVNNTI